MTRMETRRGGRGGEEDRGEKHGGEEREGGGEGGREEEGEKRGGGGPPDSGQTDVSDRGQTDMSEGAAAQRRLDRDAELHEGRDRDVIRT